MSLRLLRFISEAPLLVFVFTEAPKRKRDGENRSKHLFYRTRGSKEDSTTFDEPCLYTKKADKAFWLVKTIWFLFVDKVFVRSANRQLSKILSLSLLDRRVLAKGLSRTRD